MFLRSETLHMSSLPLTLGRRKFFHTALFRIYSCVSLVTLEYPHLRPLPELYPADLLRKFHLSDCTFELVSPLKHMELHADHMCKTCEICENMKNLNMWKITCETFPRVKLKHVYPFHVCKFVEFLARLILDCYFFLTANG